MAYQKVYMDQIQSSSLLCQLSQMWRKEILCDAIIRTGTVTTKAHRIVLVAACPMLQCMDGASMGNQLEVKLSSDVSQDAVVAFLQYLYEGFMMLTEDNVRHVEKIARLLQVDSISKCCADFYKVLQNEIGSTINHEPKFFFEAASAEFRHVRASELLRSMQNDSAKRLSDSDELSSRKRVKASRTSQGNQLQVVADSLELIQSDTDASSGKLKSGSEQKASVSVSAHSDSPLDTQCIDVSDDEQMPSPTRCSPFLKPNSDSQFYIPSVRPPVTHAGRSSINSQSDNKSNSQLPSLFPGKDLNPIPVTLTTPHQPSKLSTSQLDIPLRPNTTDSQIVIQPMELLDRFSSPVSVVSVSNGQDSPDMDGGSKAEESPGETAGLDDVDKVGGSSSGSALMPDMSIVKVEKSDCDDSYNMCGLAGEDYGMGGDEGDDDMSDSETYTYDMGQSTAGGDEHNTSWYTQTFRDGGSQSTGEKAQQKLKSDGASMVKGNDMCPPLKFKHWFRDTECFEEVLKQRIVRALALLKSPIVFMRPLQRKINGVKSEELKAACASLSREGFGQFVSKFESNILQRDAFFKPAPGILTADDPYLAKSLVPYEIYCNNFNDVSLLPKETLKVIYVAHPHREYVQGLCKGLVEDQDVQMMQKAINCPVPYLGPSPAHARTSSQNAVWYKGKSLSSMLTEKRDLKNGKNESPSVKSHGSGSSLYQLNQMSHGTAVPTSLGSISDQKGQLSTSLFRDYSPHSLNRLNGNFSPSTWQMSKETPRSSPGGGMSSGGKYLTPSAEEFSSLSPSVLFERYFGSDIVSANPVSQSSSSAAAVRRSVPIDSHLVSSSDRIDAAVRRLVPIDSHLVPGSDRIDTGEPESGCKTDTGVVDQASDARTEKTEIFQYSKIEYGEHKAIVKTEPYISM